MIEKENRSTSTTQRYSILSPIFRACLLYTINNSLRANEYFKG